MTAATDKARFYLEQTVPELREWERKGIFNSEELTAINRKRSDFEHTLNARGSTPNDYSRYVEFETNLSALHRKRCKRLGIKSPFLSQQRRIFFILDRATRKFHGDIRLWMQYIQYARSQKAHKKIEAIWTSVLRLHPTKPELWISAAQWYNDEQADIRAARAQMQRGVRFCKDKQEIWIEYARLEMVYIAKIAARRHILGLDELSSKRQKVASDEEETGDMIALPDVSLEDESPLDEEQLQGLASSPALSGAIPIAIFDGGLEHFSRSPKFVNRFFDMITSFDRVPCTPKILQHIVDTMPLPTCSFRVYTAGIELASPEFPQRLGQGLKIAKACLKESPQSKRTIAEAAVVWLTPLVRSAELEEVDSGVQRVLRECLRKYLKIVESEAEGIIPQTSKKRDDLLGRLRASGRTEDAKYLASFGNSNSATLHESSYGIGEVGT